MKGPFKKPRTAGDAERHLWWGVFAVVILLLVADLMYVAGSQ